MVTLSPLAPLDMSDRSYAVIVRRVVPAILMLVLMTIYLSHSQGQGSLPRSNNGPTPSPLHTSFESALHPVDAPSFLTDDGEFHLPGPPTFQKLGKKVLILDVDTRPVLDPSEANTPRMIGILGHYAFASMHGYDYKFVRAHDDPELHATWAKVGAIKKNLMLYEYVVFMDADVIISYPQLPLEWLLNYWSMSNDTTIMMAEDPNEPQNYDSKGRLLLNTGFIIARQSNQTQEMFDSWIDCPSERIYPGCGHWRYEYFHEQSVFGEFIRDDFSGIRKLPCAEANGDDAVKERTRCGGTFVKHLWLGKDYGPDRVSKSIFQYFLPWLRQQFDASGMNEGWIAKPEDEKTEDKKELEG